MVTLKDSPAGVTFAVKVHPRARRNAITGVIGDAIKLALTAPPVEGRANQAMVEFLAGFFEIPRSSITITSGAKSRLKVLCIAGLSKRKAEQQLAKILNFKF